MDSEGMLTRGTSSESWGETPASNEPGADTGREAEAGEGLHCWRELGAEMGSGMEKLLLRAVFRGEVIRG